MLIVQGHKKMLLNRGADLVGGPTYLGRSGGHAPQEIYLYVYALKSILVHSETNIIIGIILKMDPYF